MSEYRRQRQVFDNLLKNFKPDRAVTSGPAREKPDNILVNLNIPIAQPVLGEMESVIADLNRKAPGHRPEEEHHLTIRAIADMAPPADNDVLHQWTATATQIINQHKPFEVEVRGISTFPNVAFAGVFVPPEFMELHQALLGALPSRRPDQEGSHMVPHAAIIYYTHPPFDLMPHLAKLKNHSFGKFTVSEFKLEGRSIGLNHNTHYPFSTISFSR